MDRKVAITDLSYPCVRIFDDETWAIVHRADDLSTMYSDQYMHRASDPLVVDSNFHIYEMTQLKMKGLETSLLLTGARNIDVTFSLAYKQSSEAEVRKLLYESLVQTDEDSNSELWTLFYSQTPLSEILKVVENGLIDFAPTAEVRPEK
ncbi:MAG: hypothetical protein KDB03_16430 [Planctomycetales bacterium]|nr:hypothetical protein [Planctomycetales bacterium]